MRRWLPDRRYRSGTRWCAWRWTDVEDPCDAGSVYLTRLHLVQTPWCSVMLHWLRRSDPHPDLHDHPVGFVSLVLRGGYWEVRPGGEYRYVRWLQRKRPTDAHRITRVDKAPAVTLVFAGPVVRAWGFHAPDGWVPWRRYVEELRDGLR